MTAHKRQRTKKEKLFLETAAQLNGEGKAYCHAEMKRRLGYRSINGVWEIYTRLVRDGFIKPDGKVRVVVDAPVLTSKAKRFLKAA